MDKLTKRMAAFCGYDLHFANKTAELWVIKANCLTMRLSHTVTKRNVELWGMRYTYKVNTYKVNCRILAYHTVTAHCHTLGYHIYL